jgi:hypothetical protein
MIVDLYDSSKITEQLAEDIVFDFNLKAIFHNGQKFDCGASEQLYYSNNKPLFRKIGNFEQGHVFNNTPIRDILTAILFDWQDPEFTLTFDRQGVYEVGTVIPSLMISVFVNPKASEYIASYLQYNGVSLQDPQIGVTTYNYEVSPQEGITEDTVVTLQTLFKNQQNDNVQGSIQQVPIQFVRRTYYGSLTQIQSQNDIKLLDSRLSASVRTNENSLTEAQFVFDNKKFCIAVPEEQELVSFKDENSIELIEQFTKSQLDITNSLGDTHTYNVYLFNWITSANGLYSLKFE